MVEQNAVDKEGDDSAQRAFPEAVVQVCPCPVAPVTWAQAASSQQAAQAWVLVAGLQHRPRCMLNRFPAEADTSMPLLQLCLSKGLVKREPLREAIEKLEGKAALQLGAKLTVKAWTDPAFKVRACWVVQAWPRDNSRECVLASLQGVCADTVARQLLCALVTC